MIRACAAGTTALGTARAHGAILPPAIHEHDDVAISGESSSQVVEEHGLGSSDDHQVRARRGIRGRHDALRGIGLRWAFRHQREPAGRETACVGGGLVADQLAKQWP